jgi:hypothetical protein
MTANKRRQPLKKLSLISPVGTCHSATEALLDRNSMPVLQLGFSTLDAEEFVAEDLGEEDIVGLVLNLWQQTAP